MLFGWLALGDSPYIYIIYIYEDRLKSFELQHEDGITCQNHSGTIVHVLQDT